MAQIRAYPKATGLVPTDAFVIDRAGDGTMYVEALNAGLVDIIPAVDPSGVTDSTAAILAAAALGAASAVPTRIQLPPGIVTISQTLPFNYNNCCMEGAGEGQTFLRYIGASTTIDLIQVGDGTNPVAGATFGGFSIESNTTMTAGSAMYLRKVIGADIEITCVDQTRFTAVGNKLFHGIWFDGADNCTWNGRYINAQAEGFRVNGLVGGNTFKSDVTIGVGGRIENCAVGVHIGGAFGGFQCFTKGIIANGTNILQDQALAAEGNRELFFIGSISDSATTGAAYEINETPIATGCTVNITGGWYSSSVQGHGIWVKACAGQVNIDGVTCLNNGQPTAGNFANCDGVRVDDAAAQVNINGGTFKFNTGYGINPNVASNNVMVSGVNARNNTVGQINFTHQPVINPQYGYITAQQILAAAFELDANAFWFLSGSTPQLVGNPNLFMTFDRSNGLIEFDAPSKTGGASILSLYTGPGFYNSNNGLTLAQLNAASGGAGAAGPNARAWITDATTAYGSATIGTAAVGGGANGRPVISLGGAWVYSG